MGGWWPGSGSLCEVGGQESSPSSRGQDCAPHSHPRDPVMEAGPCPWSPLPGDAGKHPSISPTECSGPGHPSLPEACLSQAPWLSPPNLPSPWAMPLGDTPGVQVCPLLMCCSSHPAGLNCLTRVHGTGLMAPPGFDFWPPPHPEQDRPTQAPCGHQAGHQELPQLESPLYITCLRIPWYLPPELGNHHGGQVL